MRHPTLAYSKTTRIADQLAHGEDPAVDPLVEWVGTGEEVDLAPIQAAAESIWQRASSWTDPDRDRFEGIAAVEFAQALEDMPTEVLDDQGFWRYLAIKYFWPFIAWREERPFAAGKHMKYVDASRNTESVLSRMYLRVNALGGQEHGDLASAIKDGTDFWRSHVIRVRSGSAPPIVRALARRQSTDRLSTTPLRVAARQLNRTWANIVLHAYDDEAAERLVDQIWDAVEDD